MDRARIALVGCGLFGESHLQAYRAVRSAEIVAAYDVDRSRAEQRAEEFDIPRVCDTLEEICSLGGVDAIDVVTPEDDHLEPVLAALSAGKHVFVEKPLATDLSDCDRMVEAAKAAGRFLMPGHILRFETKYAMLHDEVRSGRLGRVVSMHARRNRRKSLLPRYGRTHPALETSLHDIDLILWYAASPVRRVRGYGRNATGSKHPDTFWGVIEFEDDSIAIVESIWLIPEVPGIVNDDAFRLVGSEGVAELQIVPASLAYWRESGYHAPDVCYDPRVANSARGALRDELACFCECVADNRPPQIVTAEDGRQAVRVALALMESISKDQDIVLSKPSSG